MLGHSGEEAQELLRNPAAGHLLAKLYSRKPPFDGKQLVPGVKALLAHIHHDPAWARVQPPLFAFPAADRAAATAGYDQVRTPAAQARTG